MFYDHLHNPLLHQLPLCAYFFIRPPPSHLKYFWKTFHRISVYNNVTGSSISLTVNFFESCEHGWKILLCKIFKTQINFIFVTRNCIVARNTIRYVCNTAPSLLIILCKYLGNLIPPHACVCTILFEFNYLFLYGFSELNEEVKYGITLTHFEKFTRPQDFSLDSVWQSKIFWLSKRFSVENSLQQKVKLGFHM